MMVSTPADRDAADTETTLSTSEDVAAFAAALDDEGCREILQMTADEYCTASEIANECDMALSTTYRKLDLLTDADLLTERTNIHRSGNHATAYTQKLESLFVDITSDSGIEVTISYEESTDEPAARVEG
jgi:predicted transcriptional regulator